MKILLYITLLFSNKEIISNHKNLIIVKNNKELKDQLEYIWQGYENKPKIVLIKF